MEEVKRIPREICPVCGSRDRTHMEIGAGEIFLPILPICVDTKREDDILFPIKLEVCNGCGLLYLSEVVDPKSLYQIFHSEAIGAVWGEEFEKFSKIIKENLDGRKVLEVGAGTGKLITKILGNGLDISVIDPSYSGPTENVHVYKELFNEEFAKKHTQEFDAVISEHTIEHFLEFQDYFKSARDVLKKGGKLFTSVPNQEFSFLQGQTNQINLEHTALCTNLHWIYLHAKWGFKIEKILFHRGHSIQLVSKMVSEIPEITLNTKELSIEMSDRFSKLIKEKLEKVKRMATPDKENWIFGAANTTQWLFALGLDGNIIKGILDNSDLKRDKRLYGTNLFTKKPEEVVKRGRNNLRIFLNLGGYNKNVLKQIKNINSSVECVIL